MYNTPYHKAIVKKNLSTFYSYSSYSEKEKVTFIKRFSQQLPTRIEFLFSLPMFGTVAEIGVSEGSFSKCILHINKPKALHLIDCWEYQKSPAYTNDPSNASQQEQDRRFKNVQKTFQQYKNVYIHKVYSLAAAKTFPKEYFDWIYIDANHTYNAVKKDLEAWYPKVKKTGIIAGHDYTKKPFFPIGVIQAVDEFMQKHDMEMFLIDNDSWHSWAIRRKQPKRTLLEIASYLSVTLRRFIAKSQNIEQGILFTNVFFRKAKRLTLLLSSLSR